MINYLKVYIITFLIFIIIDFFWIGVLAKNLYRKQLGNLLKDNFNIPVALVFYLFFIIGLIFFVIDKAVVLNSSCYALSAGMFFGFITYATYDITNLATLKNWPVKIVLIDIVWGSFICGITSLLSYKIIRSFDLL